MIVRATDMLQSYHMDLPEAIRRKIEIPPQSVGPRGVADHSLYRRMGAAGFETLTCFPALAAFADPDGLFWRYREEGMLSRLSADETRYGIRHPVPRVKPGCCSRPARSIASSATGPRHEEQPMPRSRRRGRADGAPDALGGDRHLDVVHAELRQRVDDGVDDRERRRRAALATRADAETMARRRHLDECAIEDGRSARGIA